MSDNVVGWMVIAAEDLDSFDLQDHHKLASAIEASNLAKELSAEYESAYYVLKIVPVEYHKPL